MKPSSSPCQLCPLVLPGKTGPLIAFYHPPEAGVAARGDVLVVPAFAEEMNRCRSMVTLQAHALAALGMGTLVLDLHGTGDSAGEFDQATWDGWRSDLQCGLAWLRQHGRGCRTLFGVRLGALMAAQMAADDASIDRLLLWLPVIAGKTYWTQFLRIRIAAELGKANGIKSTETLRQLSAQGLAVEASGYQVGPTMAQRLDTLTMVDGQQLRGKQVAWFEVAPNADSALPRANAKQAEDWRGKGVEVSVVQVLGPQFWLAHEREVAPALIESSAAAVRGWLAAPTLAPDDAPQAPVALVARAASAEYPVAFRCGGDDELAGIVHRGADGARVGVVIVVAGGPQYRVGAHRQFVSLARLCAGRGFPVLRFDLRGMGDSSGLHVGYDQSRPDIRSAIDEFLRLEPGVREVALFGECNSATGILFYAALDERVRQIALANPWVRTPEVQAEAILKHYYLDRLRSREFWQHVRSGRFDALASLRSLLQLVVTFVRGRKRLREGAGADGQADFDHLPLPSKTAQGLRRFRGRVLLLMSGRDLIAREFDQVTQTSKDWQGLLDDPRISRKDIADADHTFSKPEAKAEAQGALLDWLVAGSGQRAGTV